MHEFESPTLTFVRDLFIFACFTALSFVDMKELTTDEIVEVNGEKWIIGKRHKNRSDGKSVFGEINYRTMCKQLKKIIKECDGKSRQFCLYLHYNEIFSYLELNKSNEKWK